VRLCIFFPSAWNVFLFLFICWAHIYVFKVQFVSPLKNTSSFLLSLSAF
jgi:hypothetical protein